MEFSPITPTKDAGLECHIKSEMNVPGLVESPSGYVMTIDNTSYVTVEGGRYAGDFRLDSRDTSYHVTTIWLFFFISSTYLCDREKTDYSSQDPLYTLSQRFDPPAITYEVQTRAVSFSFWYSLVRIYWSRFFVHRVTKKKAIRDCKN